MKTIIGSLAAALVAVSASATAATIYDESVSGDLTETLGSMTTDLGLLAAGANTIVGFLDAGDTGNPDDGDDEFDTFLFTVDADFSVNLSFSNGNGFAGVYETSPFNSLSFQGAGTDIFASLGAFAAGTYAMAIIPSSNGGAPSWSMTINVADSAPVPVPGAAVLMLGGLGALGAMRRRAQQAS